jgi:protein-tyrosine-phosphatase
MHYILTVCDQAAGEVCPIWPGKPIEAHWGVPDPAAVTSSVEAQTAAFRDALLTLQRRIQFFLTFRFKELKRTELKLKLDEAGKLA